jgi:hypothetical protein
MTLASTMVHATTALSSGTKPLYAPSLKSPYPWGAVQA